MLKGEERQQTKNGIFSAHGNVQFFFLSTKYWLALAGGDRMDVAINNQIPGGALITQHLFLKLLCIVLISILQKNGIILKSCCAPQLHRFEKKRWHYFEMLWCTCTDQF
jgi:hypothetical protein